ncbi:MAG: hypothetical protein CVT92_02070 [Bacteroidetes bacterium HGW-Bacteroidetes-1]|jgi:DNA repair exonuclease SbcCD nuclease subunit|nr:MAG: hypothetical protein CVT92_02070 [Bacteroidetes bacterium HGW-Bacteroidetes-1]
MDKLIYIPDPHYGARPISRKDNYNRSILNKLEHAFKVARKNHCTVIIGGDLFDKPSISMLVFIELLMLFEKYSDVKMVILRGNHFHDGSPESSPLTMLGMFMRNVTLSDGRDYLDLPTTRLIFADNVTDPNTRDEFLSPELNNVLLTHHIIVKDPVIYKHYLIADLKTNADYVLIADYHPEQGIIQRGKTTFVSTGALARRKNTSHDVGRKPKFAYLSDKGVVLKEIPCETDVFIEKIIDDTPEVNVLENVKQMVELMDTSIMSENLFNALDIFAKTTKVDDDVIKFVKERLQNGT